MYFAKRRCHEFDVGKLRDDAVDKLKKRVGIALRLGAGNVRTGDAEAFLQILLVADQRIDLAHNAAQHLMGLRDAAHRCP